MSAAKPGDFLRRFQKGLESVAERTDIVAQPADKPYPTSHAEVVSAPREETKPMNEAVEQREDESTFSAKMHFSGDIVSAEDIRILGGFSGTLKCRTLYVGPNAVVKADIIATSISNYGTIDGDIVVDQIAIYKMAQQMGKLRTKGLGMQFGAILKATVECDQTHEIDVHGARPPQNTQPTVSPSVDNDFTPSFRVVQGGSRSAS